MADSHTPRQSRRGDRFPASAEPGMLSRFGRAAANSPSIPEGPGTMDAVTVGRTSEKEAEPRNERRAPREPSRWNGLVEFLKSF